MCVCLLGLDASEDVNECLGHTSYLLQTPQTCLCKKKLPGVNLYRFNAKKLAFFTDLTQKIGVFYRFNAKNWRFFTDLTQKIGVFYRFNAKNWRFSV